MKYRLILFIDHVFFCCAFGMPMALFLGMKSPDADAAPMLLIMGTVMTLFLLPGLLSDAKKAGGARKLWERRNGPLWGVVKPVKISDFGRVQFLVIAELLLGLVFIFTEWRASEALPQSITDELARLTPPHDAFLYLTLSMFIVSRLGLLMRGSWAQTAYLYSVILILLSSAFEGATAMNSVGSMGISIMVAFEAVMFFSMFRVVDLAEVEVPLHVSNPEKFNSGVCRSEAIETKEPPPC